MITKDLGVVTAYGYAVTKGYTGTEEEFAELMASYATVAESAAQSAQTATEKAQAAAQAVLDAVAAKDAAVQAKNDAVDAKDAAAQSATNAASSATAASGSATNASQSAQAASDSASAAAQSATDASGSATAANTAKEAAVSAKGAAETAQSKAETAQSKAEEAQGKAEEAADALSAEVEQIETNKNDIAELRSSVGSVITNTASGDIASFTDGADDYPVKDLVAHIDPVQDLHGYANPWPGGGKNLIPYPYKDGSQDYRGVTFTANSDSTVSVSGTATGGASYFNLYGDASTAIPNWISAGTTYTISGGVASSRIQIVFYGNPSTVFQAYNEAPETFTVPDDLSVFTGFAIVIQVPSGNTVSGIVKPMIEQGSTATSYEPYSNICPITGWTGANVTRTGKNLFDKSKFQNLATNHEYVAQSYNCKAIQLAPNTTYTVSQSSGVAESTPVLLLNNKVAVNETGYFDCRLASHTRTYTTDETGCLYIGSLGGDSATNARIDACNIQIEVGSTATAYEPYNGDTYAVTFPTEAGTVYGGTLDVTTGVLTVDTVSKTISSGRATAINQLTNTTRFLVLDALVSNWYKRFIICDRLKRNDYATDAVGFSHGDESSNVFIKLDKSLGLTTSALISEWLSNNPLQFVYKLETPTTYQLTPTEVKTLLGANNIFADTGAVDVEYCADTKKYIDNAIATAIAAL